MAEKRWSGASLSAFQLALDGRSLTHRRGDASVVYSFPEQSTKIHVCCPWEADVVVIVVLNALPAVINCQPLPKSLPTTAILPLEQSFFFRRVSV